MKTDLFWLDRVREIDGGQAILFFLLLVFILGRVAGGRRLAEELTVGRAVGVPASLWTGLLLWLAAVCLLLFFRGRGGGVLSIGVPGVRQSAQQPEPDRLTINQYNSALLLYIDIVC